MTRRITSISFLLSCWVGAALAQPLVVYAPPEGDFRVLFPASPAVNAGPQGAVAYSASAEGMTFTVYRRDPAQQPVGENPAAAIQQRLHEADGDRRVRQRGKDEGDAPGGEYVFMVDGRASIHRIVVAGARYYELAVAMPGSELRQGRVTARDFFGSFQAGAAPAATGALAALSPDVLCKNRSNSFSRAFCEYSSCLRSQHRGQPYCQKLLSFR